MVKEIALFNGPVYFRLSRVDSLVVIDDSHKIAIGKGQIINCGDDYLTIIAIGVMVERSLKAAQLLKKEGVQAGVIKLICLP